MLPVVVSPGKREAVLGPDDLASYLKAIVLERVLNTVGMDANPRVCQPPSLTFHPVRLSHLLIITSQHPGSISVP